VSSLIYDRWLTHKLATFMGSIDPLDPTCSAAAAGLDLQRTSEEEGASGAVQAGHVSRCTVHLHSLLGTYSRPQVAQSVPCSLSPHASAT